MPSSASRTSPTTPARCRTRRCTVVTECWRQSATQRQSREAAQASHTSPAVSHRHTRAQHTPTIITRNDHCSGIDSDIVDDITPGGRWTTPRHSATPAGLHNHTRCDATQCAVSIHDVSTASTPALTATAAVRTREQVCGDRIQERVCKRALLDDRHHGVGVGAEQTRLVHRRQREVAHGTQVHELVSAASDTHTRRVVSALSQSSTHTDGGSKHTDLLPASGLSRKSSTCHSRQHSTAQASAHSHSH